MAKRNDLFAKGNGPNEKRNDLFAKGNGPNGKRNGPNTKKIALFVSKKDNFYLFNYRTNFFITTTPPAITASDPAITMNIV